MNSTDCYDKKTLENYNCQGWESVCICLNELNDHSKKFV